MPNPPAGAPQVPERHVLTIAFHYPPDNSSTGVLRTLKFTQYLPRHGWRCTVLSVPVSVYPNIDNALTGGIPNDVRVFRAWTTDLKKRLNIGGIYPGFLTYPDRYWPWYFSATRLGTQLIRGERFDALYSTFPWPTAHLIALRLKMKSGLPWVADFRDPWLEESMPRLERWVAAWFEEKIARHADRVVCNTPAMRRMFLERYPHIAPEKFVTITNGYDEPDFAALVPDTCAKFQILYPGVIDPDSRNPAPLLAGIATALSRGWLRRDDLEITFLGCGPYGGKPRFREDIARNGLADLVKVHEPRIPYHEALRRLGGADVLVVLVEPTGDGKQAEAVRGWARLQVPAKLYEYLRLGRSILALASPGAITELLAETGGGRVVPPHDIEGIALALKEYYAHRGLASPNAAAPPDKIARYSRENLSALLGRELDAIAR
jgi:glycosyltransferase involved in cell wall biosynthesis